MTVDHHSQLGAERVVVIVRPRARADKIDEAVHILEEIVDPTRSDPGCIELRLFHGQQDAQSFLIVEHWESLGAVMAHGASDYMAEYMAKKDDVFEVSPTGEIFLELRPEQARTPG